MALTFFVLREIPWWKKGKMSFAGRLWEWRPVNQLMVSFAGISMPFFFRGMNMMLMAEQTYSSTGWSKKARNATDILYKRHQVRDCQLLRFPVMSYLPTNISFYEAVSRSCLALEETSILFANSVVGSMKERSQPKSLASFWTMCKSVM